MPVKVAGEVNQETHSGLSEFALGGIFAATLVCSFFFGEIQKGIPEGFKKTA